MGNDMFDNLKEEVPEHLEPLKKIIYSGCFFPYDEKEYGEIGYKLLDVASGNKEALKDISTFIRRQHQTILSIQESRKTLVQQATQWLYWAKNWTVRNTEKK
jgi:hypothetical protein